MTTLPQISPPKSAADATEKPERPRFVDHPTLPSFARSLLALQTVSCGLSHRSGARCQPDRYGARLIPTRFNITLVGMDGKAVS